MTIQVRQRYVQELSMGIFKRKSEPANQGNLEEERYKLICRELQAALRSEYESLSELMDMDGRDPESVAYETRTLKILSQLTTYLEEILGSTSNGQSFSPDWRRSLELVKSEEFLSAPNRAKLSDQLVEVSTYYVDSVKRGTFVMMPNATISSSKKYRSYLLGNNLNGDLKWGWDHESLTARETLDSYLTQIVARMVTSILDKVGNGQTLEAACNLGVAICLNWEKSGDRAQLA